MARSVRQLLDQAKGFHHALSDVYSSLADEVKQERVRMLLDYMSRHEERLETALSDYEEGTSQQLLDHMFKFTPTASTAQFLEEFLLTPELPFEEVVRTVLKFDDYIVRFYRQIAEEAASDEVRTLFTKLARQEESDERRIARATSELERL